LSDSDDRLYTSPRSSRDTSGRISHQRRQQQYSLGLLQLSYSDNAAYGCGFTTEAEVTNPDRNLACGVRIMTKLVGRAARIGGDNLAIAGGAAAYWSTLRSTSKARRQILDATTSVPVCTAP
ncbi:MAG: hypothetical protein DI537_37225, partial [Stutzerimonas stutzeri]